MGQKRALYINPRRLMKQQKPCMKEMMAFLNCLALNQNNDDKCLKQIEVLNGCMDAQSAKRKGGFGSINYHLARLSRGGK